jgi:2-iminobutanoate/2-iminopropanoate deaminase
MAKVKKILVTGGFSMEQVVKTTVYLFKKEDFQRMNEIYSKYFPEKSPARTTVVTAFPSSETLVEIDVIASK